LKGVLEKGKKFLRKKAGPRDPYPRARGLAKAGKAKKVQ